MPLHPQPSGNQTGLLFLSPVLKVHLLRFPGNCSRITPAVCVLLHLFQTYLKAPNGDETRIRQRGADGNFIYFQTTKRKISDTKRIEIEKRLTKDEYLKLLLDVDTTKHQIRKTRYCLVYENQYFEIDVYPFWNDKAIMEIELRSENQEISIPNSIKIIKEVTDDDEYKNSSLAKNIK